MTLLELSESADPLVRLRAEVRNFQDMATWIQNGQLHLPACLNENPVQEQSVAVKFHESFITQLSVSTEVIIMVHMGRTAPSGAYDRMYQLIDSDNMYSDVMGKIWYCGVVNAQDWPFVTTELVAHFVNLQKKSGRTNVPTVVATHLPHLFDKVDYSELLNWYQNDLLSLTADCKGLPLLSDIMFDRALHVEPKNAVLPVDITL